MDVGGEVNKLSAVLSRSALEPAKESCRPQDQVHHLLN